jgi:hypothetical protein
MNTLTTMAAIIIAITLTLALRAFIRSVREIGTGPISSGFIGDGGSWG